MSISRPIVLATQSLQRQELFATLELPFLIEPSDIDELAIDDTDHIVRARLVAEGKAQVAAQKHPNSIVIAADTFLLLHDERLEKPLTKDEGKVMLQKLSGKMALCLSGWAYFDLFKNEYKSGTVVTEVTFRPLSLAEIEHYVATQPVTKWSGSFSTSHSAGIALIARINGSLNGVMGLPLEEIVPLLMASGVL